MHRSISAVLVVAFLLVTPCVASAQDGAQAAVAEGAKALLRALGRGDVKSMEDLVGASALVQTDREMIRAISAQHFHLTRVWLTDSTASVEYEWLACFDHEAFAKRTLPDLRAEWEAARSDQEANEKQYLSRLIQLRGLIEKPTQVMVLQKYGNSGWRARRQWFAAVPPDSVPIDLAHERETLTPPEEKCGGATPEAAAKRVIEAWKAHNVVDVVWCSQPGEPREWYAESDKTMLLAMMIKEFRIARVWVRGNMAWVEYHWSARLLHQPYQQHLIDQMNLDPPPTEGGRQAAIQQIRAAVISLKQTVELPTHFIRLRRHGRRWYNAGDPLGTALPAGAPTRGVSPEDK